MHYAVPSDFTIQQWSKTLGEYNIKLAEAAGKGAEWLREKAPDPLALPVVFAGGCAVGVVEGVGYMAQLPLIAAQLPYEIPKGSAKEFASGVALGMYAFFRHEVPGIVKADPILGAGRIVGLFLLAPKSLVKYDLRISWKAIIGKAPERSPRGSDARHESLPRVTARSRERSAGRNRRL